MFPGKLLALLTCAAVAMTMPRFSLKETNLTRMTRSQTDKARGITVDGSFKMRIMPVDEDEDEDEDDDDYDDDDGAPMHLDDGDDDADEDTISQWVQAKAPDSAADADLNSLMAQATAKAPDTDVPEAKLTSPKQSLRDEAAVLLKHNVRAGHGQYSSRDHPGHVAPATSLPSKAQ